MGCFKRNSPFFFKYELLLLFETFWCKSWKFFTIPVFVLPIQEFRPVLLQPEHQRQ